MANPEHPYLPLIDDRGHRSYNGENIGSMLAPDVEDWLKLTNWHDVEYRKKKLSAYRSTENTDNTKKDREVIMALPSELAKMRLAEQLRSANLPPAPKSRGNVGGSSGMSDRGRFDRVGDINSIGNSGSYNPFRKARDRSTSPFRDGPGEHDKYRTRSYTQPYRPGYDYARSRDESPRPRVRSGGHKRRTTRDRVDRAKSPNGDRAYDKRDMRRELDNLEYPDHLTFDDPDRVCFFLVKSYSWSNVYDCMEEGIWATRPCKTEKLTEAFNSGKTVVLFFSVNGSESIQGYALMTSRPSKEIARPKWWYTLWWNCSQPFQVKWINKVYVENKHVRHILNPLNEHQKVTRGRNCQEIEDYAGRRMLPILESCAIAKYNQVKRTGTI